MVGLNKLLGVGKRFRSQFKLIDGREFFGQMLDIPDTSRVSNFLSARRYLRTAPNTFLVPGNVMIAHDTTYIIAEHGEGFSVDPIYKHFKLFGVDQILTWYGSTVQENAVTGVKEVFTDQDNGVVYLSTQPKASMVDHLHIPQEQHVAICDRQVLVDDRVGDFVVVKSDMVLGVYVLELKKR